MCSESLCHAADATVAEGGMAHPELLAGPLRRTRAEHHILAAMGQAGVSEPLKELDTGSCNNPEPGAFSREEGTL